METENSVAPDRTTQIIPPDLSRIYSHYSLQTQTVRTRGGWFIDIFWILIWLGNRIFLQCGDPKWTLKTFTGVQQEVAWKRHGLLMSIVMGDGWEPCLLLKTDYKGGPQLLKCVGWRLRCKNLYKQMSYLFFDWLSPQISAGYSGYFGSVPLSNWDFWGQFLQPYSHGSMQNDHS